MSDMSERKSKMFWLNDSGKVVQSLGYECPPNKGAWWFPKLGYSSWCVYKTERAAKAMARKECVANIDMWTERLEAL